MIRFLTASAWALVAATVTLLGGSGSALAAPPLVWDGVVIPDSNCVFDGPAAWRATYRPYIAGSTDNTQASQLVVFTNFQRNDYGFRNTSSTGQFNGVGVANTFFVGSELMSSTVSNTGIFANRNFNFVQSPGNVKATTKFVKITGTIIRSDTSGPGLACATTILGVFVQRTNP
jgi:hypothetical protein